MGKYMDMLQEAQEERLLNLMEQTELCLGKIGAMVQRDRNAPEATVEEMLLAKVCSVLVVLWMLLLLTRGCFYPRI